MPNNLNIAIITTGYLPIPPSKGGAVEALCFNFINKNEIYKKTNLYCFSIHDKEAFLKSKEYKFCKFIFIKSSFMSKIFDKLIYFFAKYIFRKKKVSSYRHILSRLSYLRKVSKYIKRNNFDKLILENHFTEYLCLKWNKNYLKYKDNYYYHCHNVPSGAYGCEDIIKNTKKFICVSDYIKREISEYFKIADDDKFFILKNAVDEKKFLKLDKSEEILNKYSLSKNDKIVMFTGRLSEEKGIIELLKATQIAKNDFKLIIIGSTFYGVKVKSQFENLLNKEIALLSDKVIFTGYIPYDEISKYYSIADIMVLPAIWDDPAPLTIIESLKCGIPLITTNSGGIPQYASTSAIILNRDMDLIKNIASKIDYLLDNPKICEDMSSKAISITKDLNLNNYYFDLINCLIED